jgi:ribosome biogenesis protein YTM1
VREVIALLTSNALRSCYNKSNLMFASITSHKSWVADVQWSPTDPYVLASNSHDGSLKVWDIRSSIPLHTVMAVSKKGEKALCLAFGEENIYSGGSDCVVNKFACKV